MSNFKKTCPYSDQCFFLHEDAQNCKYGKQCERLFCMFKHEFSIKWNNVNSNSTFINTSQDDKSSKEELFMCDMCDFASARKVNIKDHKSTIGAQNVFHLEPY